MTMSFDENKYLSWYIPRLSPQSGVINLHSSGMPAVRVEDLKPPSPTGFEMLGLVEERLAANLKIEQDELVFTSGATGGTLLALLTLGSRHSSFVVETPIYEPMMRQAERLGQLKLLARTFENRWQIDIDRADALIDDNTDVVLITEPHNPSGVFSSSASIAALADICKRRGAYLLINEVYLGYASRSSYHGLFDNVLIVSSYSKLLGAYSNRVGWVSGPVDVIRRLRCARLNMGTGSVPSAAAGIAFADAAVERTKMAKAAANKWADVVDTWVAGCSSIDWMRPEGPGFGAVILPNGVDDLAFINCLYNEKKVLAVPGSLFLAPGTFRISWLNVGDRLHEGLDIVAQTLSEFGIE